MTEFGKKQWVEMFKEIGLTEEQMRKWHSIFESKNAEKHQEFLAWLGIESDEIDKIRAACGN